MDKTWLNARDLFKSLAIPEAYVSFTTWFGRWVEGQYKINKDWVVEGEGDNLEFKITQRVADEIAQAEKGPPVERMRHYTRTVEFAKINWNQQLSQQTHAITEGDEE